MEIISYLSVGFHDQSVGSNMEIVEHLVVDDPVVVGSDLYVAENLVMDDLVAVGGDLYVVEHLVVSNEMIGVDNLAYVDGDLHITTDMEFVDSLVVDVDEDFLMKNYVQFVLGSEHVDWMVEILVFDRVM